MPDYSRVGAGHLAALMHRALKRGDAAGLAALRAECARRPAAGGGPGGVPAGVDPAMPRSVAVVWRSADRPGTIRGSARGIPRRPGAWSCQRRPSGPRTAGWTGWLNQGRFGRTWAEARVLVVAAILAVLVFMKARMGTLTSRAGVFLLTLAMLAALAALLHMLARLTR